MKEGIEVLKVNVVLDESTLGVTKFGVITSQLHIEVGTVFFPDKEWSDLTGSVLAMWLLSLNSLIQHKDQEAILYFMDGDYSVQLECLKQTESFIRLIDSNNDEVFSGTIDISYFGKQLLAAAYKVIQHFDEQSNLEAVRELVNLSNTLSLSLRRID